MSFHFLTTPRNDSLSLPNQQGSVLLPSSTNLKNMSWLHGGRTLFSSQTVSSTATNQQPSLTNLYRPAPWPELRALDGRMGLLTTCLTNLSGDNLSLFGGARLRSGSPFFSIFFYIRHFGIFFIIFWWDNDYVVILMMMLTLLMDMMGGLGLDSNESLNNNTRRKPFPASWCNATQTPDLGQKRAPIAFE